MLRNVTICFVFCIILGRSCGSVDKGSGEDDVAKQGIQTVQPSDEVQLDESSVMVPYCSELYTVSCEESKDSSFKVRLSFSLFSSAPFFLMQKSRIMKIIGTIKSQLGNDESNHLTITS